MTHVQSRSRCARWKLVNFVLGVSGCLKSTRDLSSQQRLPLVVPGEFDLVNAQIKGLSRGKRFANTQ